MFVPLVTAHHNCRFLVSIKSEGMSLYNNSATFGVERVIENNLFRNYFLCWKCLAPTDVIFIFCDGTKWPWKGEKCKFGFYFSICVDLVFRKEAEPYKGMGPCHDSWQTDCQVKTVSARVISADGTSAGSAVFVLYLGKHSAIDTLKCFPWQTFRCQQIVHSFIQGY